MSKVLQSFTGLSLNKFQSHRAKKQKEISLALIKIYLPFKNAKRLSPLDSEVSVSKTKPSRFKVLLLKKSEKDFGGTSFPKKIVMLEKPGRTLCANINETGTSRVAAILKAPKAESFKNMLRTFTENS